MVEEKGACVPSPVEDGQADFSQPSFSAGAERAFSAAGRMHGDEQKGRTGESLKAMLFAAFTPIGDK